MSPDMILGLISGSLCLVASFAVGLHEILLNPDRPNYPNGPGHQRVVMFLFSGILLYRGVDVLTMACSAHPPHVPLSQFLGSFSTVSVAVVLVEQQLRAWLPARVHARIRHLLNIATCGHGRAVRNARRSANAASTASEPESPHVVGLALVELSRQGVQVVGPMEGVDALLEEPFGPKGKL